MKIQTKNLKEYKKIYEMTKQAGQLYYEYVFLDFVKETATFMNESSIVKIKLFLEDKDTREVDYIFVDGIKFFLLVNTYEYLEFTKKSFFSPEKRNRFLLQNLDETLDVDLEDSEDFELYQIKLTEDFTSNLKLFKDYLDTENSFVFFTKGKMVYYDEYKYFQADSGIDSTISFEMPLNVVKIIENLNPSDENDSFVLRYNNDGENKIYEIEFKDLTYSYSSSNEAELPFSPDNEEFIKSYYHDDYVILDVKNALESVKTLENFIIDTNMSSSKISFFEKYLLISLQNGNQVDYKQDIIEYSNFSRFENKDFWFSLSRLKNALSSLKIKKIDQCILRYADISEYNSVIYFSDGDEKSSLVMVESLLEEPNIN